LEYCGLGVGNISALLAEGNATQEENLPVEEELGEEDYYPSLPFAALFFLFQGIVCSSMIMMINFLCKLHLCPEKEKEEIRLLWFMVVHLYHAVSS
jgi:hypothetical protein